MELELPPKTVEVIIEQLAGAGEQARFINGEKMLEYRERVPVKPPGRSPGGAVKSEPEGDRAQAG